MSRIAHKTCNLCEASCGLLIEVDGPQVLSIKPDKNDVFSRGHICPKAFTLREVHEDPDRLRHPLRRTASGWEKISWDSAFDLSATRLAAIQRKHGRDAVATYIGNPVAHNFGTGLYSLLLLGAIGSRARFSTNSVDSNPILCSSLLLFGSMVSIPVPDLDRTQHLLIFGANPIVSNGSVMTAPDVRPRLRAIQARGGRIVVVDPRRNETAKIADEHVFIRPGRDALLLAALLHTILEEKLGRSGSGVSPDSGSAALAKCVGLGALTARIADLSPERVAGALGMEPSLIRRLAREFAAAPSACAYGRLGTSNQEFGTLSTWLIQVINIVTGNLDRAGGIMFPTPAVDLGGLARRIGQTGHLGKWKSRVRGAPEFNDEIPVACFAEEVLTPGAGQIRGLVSIASNLSLSTPNGRQVDRALEALEFFAAIDIYSNETTRHAHVILPPAWSLEQDNYEAIAYLVAIRNIAKYSHPVVPLGPGMLRDWQVVSGLALRIAEKRARGPARLGISLLRRLGAVPAPRRALDFLLRVGPHGDHFLPWSRGLNLAKLEKRPKGVDLGPLMPSLDRALASRKWRIPLDAPVILDEIDRLKKHAMSASAGDGKLLLIGRRDVRTNNSWAHNSPSMVVGRPRCTLLMNPEDAQRLDLETGDEVELKSRTGEVRCPLVVSEEVMPGVVSLPHGWGHGRDGARLRVAATQPGVSANDVTDEMAIDGIVGNAVLNGVPVEVRRADAAVK